MVHPKAISFPTYAKLLHAAIRGLNSLATRHRVRLRQSYLRVAKRAAMMAGHYAHAKQFNRHRKRLRLLRRRSAIEPVIGHMKAEGDLGRCHLKGRAGDAAKAILAAVGYNFRRLARLRLLLRLFLIAIGNFFISRSTPTLAC